MVAEVLRAQDRRRGHPGQYRASTGPLPHRPGALERGQRRRGAQVHAGQDPPVLLRQEPPGDGPGRQRLGAPERRVVDVHAPSMADRPPAPARPASRYLGKCRILWRAVRAVDNRSGDVGAPTK
ncbi:hypothetical protein GCM10023353_35540 [Tomitella cavernea]|uniref:Uncharacterized protein n=1 Tax=Tomitella cavernea TaxID=1387982 RepID=A0ABP9D1D3_9ACTN